MMDRTISVRTLVRTVIALVALAALGVGALSAFAQQTSGSSPSPTDQSQSTSGSGTDTSGQPSPTSVACVSPSPVAATGTSTTPASGSSQGTNGFWIAGPGATGDNTYLGALDKPSNGATVGTPFSVNGWGGDSTANGWGGFDDVELWNGSMGGGGTLITKGLVGLPRPDVAATLGNSSLTNTGYVITVPASANLSGLVALDLYAHTPAKGWYVHPFSLTVSGTAPVAAAAPAPASGSSGSLNPSGPGPVVSITSPTTSQNVSASSSSSFTLAGTATDPTAGAKAIDQVDLWLDGTRGSPGARDLGNATLNGDGTWSLSIVPTKYSSVNSNLYAYAHSTATGKTAVASVNFNIQG